MNFSINAQQKFSKVKDLILKKKKEIIKLHKTNPIVYSIHHLSNLLNLERSTISRWIKKEDEFLHVDNAKKYNLPEQGNKSCIWDKEEELINYFYDLGKGNLPVNSSLLLKKLYSISPELKNKNFNANKKLLYRILKKYNITLRKATHLGQPLPYNSFDKVYNFIYEVINKRKKLSIFDDNYNFNRIDETPVFLELVSDKTYEEKGAKNVIIKAGSNYKKHVTVILAITASGNKLHHS